MITLNACPLCESTQISQYHQVGLAPHIVHEIMPGIKIDAAIITRYFVCQNCHVIFQNPRLSDRELSDFYAKGYYRRTLNLTDKQKNADELFRAKTDAKIIQETLGEIGSHVDVGCSRGYLLTQVGANVEVGIEEDMKGVTEKGIDVYQRIGEVPQKPFDLVTAIHILEHVPDPLEYLRSMAKLLGKNGHLMVEVPTWKSPGGPLRLAHLYHFEPDVLKLLCKQVGLRVEHVEFTPHLVLICRLA